MLSLARLSMLLLASTISVSFLTHSAVESRLIPTAPHALFGQHERHLQNAATSDDDSDLAPYFDGSGFPKAGRTLEQKIKEAEAFLAVQVPETSAIGVGAAIVYEDQVVLSKGFGLRKANDSTTAVSERALFQIGSVTKSMIGVGIGVLVDDDKVSWRDPVKKHLPWLRLHDKYAEEHVTIGDLLAMNSGFGRAPDVADFSGAFATERALVEALANCEPEHSLRESPDYANINFVILGQLIESVSGQTWDAFLDERVWKPLGMNNTFASTTKVPAVGQEMNDGHYACDGKVLGPFSMLTSDMTELFPGRVDRLHAAGSVMSSVKDMAIFMRFILNQGHVDDVAIFKSPTTIAEMITGQGKAVGELMAYFDYQGLHFSRAGGAVTAGYGFDIIGQSIWGHTYFDKGGDTIVHHTRTGFSPAQQLGVIVMSNTFTTDSYFYLDRFRSYIMGIFLDVPRDILDLEFQRWSAMDAALITPPLPDAPLCGLSFWDNPTVIPWTSTMVDTFVGTYEVQGSEKFYPALEITRGSNGTVLYALAAQKGEVKLYGPVQEGDPKLVLLTYSSFGISGLLATPVGDGSYSVNVGVEYTISKSPSIVAAA